MLVLWRRLLQTHKRLRTLTPAMPAAAARPHRMQDCHHHALLAPPATPSHAMERAACEERAPESDAEAGAPTPARTEVASSAPSGAPLRVVVLRCEYTGDRHEETVLASEATTLRQLLQLLRAAGGAWLSRALAQFAVLNFVTNGGATPRY
jgi:hypothetical protein